MDVKGEYLDHSADHGFRYRYHCPCGQIFISGAPELSHPPLCHRCVTGGRRGRVTKSTHGGRKSKAVPGD